MITIVGLGFVGLTTALGFSSRGIKVYGFDVNIHRVDLLRKGEIPFFEPQLTDQLKKNLNKNFFIDVPLEKALKDSSFVFFCVGTPNEKDGRANLSFLFKAVKEVLTLTPKGKGSKVFVIKSTVPPSTALEKVQPLIEKYGFKQGKNIALANNPEFLREGNAWQDFICPDRIVIGAEHVQTSKMVAKLYKGFGAPIFNVSLTTAEFIKYLSNTLLASLISFANDTSMLADAIGGIDTPEAFRILHLDRRWQGPRANMATYVFPGCGFGGSCLPKDIKALRWIGQEKGYKSSFISEIINVNERIKHHAVGRILKVATKKDTIGILGLAFKPNTDDVRESPAKDIINILLDKGYHRIIVYDPMAVENFKREYDFPVQYATSLTHCIKQSKVLAIMIGWQEFVDSQKLYKNKQVVDLRYILRRVK